MSLSPLSLHCLSSAIPASGFFSCGAAICTPLTSVLALYDYAMPDTCIHVRVYMHVHVYMLHDPNWDA